MSYLIVLLSGILTSLPLIFEKSAPLSWISMIPLFYFAVKKKSAYRHGLVFSLGYYGVMYYWFICLYPLDFAGFTETESVIIIALAWGGIALLQSIGTAFVPFLYRHLQIKKELFAPVTAAALWVIFEWLQTQFWFGVPWGRLAVTQTNCLPVIQSASLLGSLFVSFLIVLTNAFLTLALKKLITAKKLHVSALIAALIFAANYIFGTAAIRLYDDEGEPLNVALIQGNIASGDKWADDSVSTSLELYTSLTREAAKETGLDIIVWPETVITTSVKNNLTLSGKISGLAAETGAVILIGAYDSVYNAESNRYDSYNAIVAFYPDGSVSDQPYYKRHLVPFGEYLPMPEIISAVMPLLTEMNLFKDSILPGEDSNLFETEYGRIGGLICFDSIYETLALDSVRDGAGLIALVTNDSWYKDSAAVYQHNGHAVLRAVENGRYIVRAANTGISSIITPAGGVKDNLEPLVRGYITSKVYMSSSRTLYSYVGDLIVWISAVYTAFTGAYKVLCDFRSRAKSRKHKK